MRKFFFLSIILFAIATSCKKNYTCNCTTTAIVTTNPNNVSSAPSPTNTATSTTLISTTTFDATKSNATKQCAALSKGNVIPPVNCAIN